ncbi:MAG: IclR family transcriptional regulator C-terminal domain-containing protein, partial [Acinetobacter sp.]
CLLTYLNDDYCIDIHHEIFKDTELLSYGRGCPRPIYVGSSPKTMVSHLSKQRMQDYYHRYQQELKQSGFAEDEPSFIQRMRKIKKQGFYFSQGEIDPNVSGLAVPVRFSNKEVPLALTLVASKNRFDFLNVEKLIEILQENAALIEQRFMELSEKGEI